MKEEMKKLTEAYAKGSRADTKGDFTDFEFWVNGEKLVWTIKPLQFWIPSSFVKKIKSGDSEVVIKLFGEIYKKVEE